MQAKRAKWKGLNLKAEHDNLVFLDESGVNINMIRRYGRAMAKRAGSLKSTSCRRIKNSRTFPVKWDALHYIL